MTNRIFPEDSPEGVHTNIHVVPRTVYVNEPILMRTASGMAAESDPETQAADAERRAALDQWGPRIHEHRRASVKAGRRDWIEFCGDMDDPKIMEISIEAQGAERTRTTVGLAAGRKAFYNFAIPPELARDFLNEYKAGAGSAIIASRRGGHFTAVIVAAGGVLAVHMPDSK